MSRSDVQKILSLSKNKKKLLKNIRLEFIFYCDDKYIFIILSWIILCESIKWKKVNYFIIKSIEVNCIMDGNKEIATIVFLENLCYSYTASVH